VLIRDNYRCQLQLEPCVGHADTADHIVPKKRGGKDVMGNLQASCQPCNQLKGDRA
jgi:5-methylcytosine-specific restriction endonuclease McrA